jgi:hypothetical protein
MQRIPRPRDDAFQHRPALTVAITMLLVAAPLAAAEGRGAASAAPQPESGQVVLDWERILMRTVYPATPIPPGVPILGFTTVAMYDAAKASLAQADSSETAAVADYNEVRRLGSANSSARTPAQTATALFLNSNSATMVGDALVRHRTATRPPSQSQAGLRWSRTRRTATTSAGTPV